MGELTGPWWGLGGEGGQGRIVNKSLANYQLPITRATPRPVRWANLQNLFGAVPLMR